MPGELYEMALAIPWMITHEALEAMLSIAARDPLPTDEIARRMHGPKSLALRDSQARDDATHLTMQDGIARITIDGPIYRYADMFVRVSGGITTEALGKDFQTALDDPAAGAILLVIDSPGGEATGINELADAIYAARGRKPIAAYIEGYGASAAYWIASAADTIIVDDSALVGSIGTVMGVPDPAKRFTRTIDFVSTQSPKKRADPTTDDGRVYLQTLVDDMTEVFIAKVMRNRGMTRKQVLAVEGGMRIGQQAIAAGLADSLGSEAGALRALVSQVQASKRPAWSRPFVGEQPMKIRDIFGGFLAAAKEQGIEIEEEEREPVTPAAPPQTAAPVQPDPQITAQLDDLKRQLSEQQRAARMVSAATFADEAVKTHKAYPAERQALYEAYLLAADDDAAHGSVTFADNTTGSRVSRLETLIGQRPAHTLTQEQIATATVGALPNADDKTRMTDDRRRALLAMTPLGQAALDRKR